MGCRAGVRAPRWYRPAPSGLNGAAHRAGARRPAAAVDPGDLWRATGPAKAGSPQGCPGRAAAPSRPHEAAAGRPCTGVPGRRDTGTRQPPPDTSGHLFDYVNKQKNYKADRRSAAKLSLNQSRGAPRRPRPRAPAPPRHQHPARAALRHARTRQPCRHRPQPQRKPQITDPPQHHPKRLTHRPLRWFQPDESGIHAVWPGAGEASVMEVRFRCTPRAGGVRCD